jgi:hypothetical protein
MKEDKIPKIIKEAKEQPLHSSDDTDAAVTGHIKEGKSRMMGMAGLPHKQDGEKMPHEHFHDKMTKALCD